FLSLCTLSPPVHAALLSRAMQAHGTSGHHCARPSPASESPAAPATSHRGTATPLCCALMKGQKAVGTSPVRSDTAPVVLLDLPPNAGCLAREVYKSHASLTLHSSSPPRLYLVHAI